MMVKVLSANSGTGVTCRANQNYFEIREKENFIASYDG
jgi:hypothetical protein